MYGQYDGYPEGYGKDLINFIKPFTLVNGLSIIQDNESIANGMDCFAAQLIAHFKTKPGGYYIVSADNTEYYEYHLLLYYVFPLKQHP